MFRASAYNNDQKYALLHDLAELEVPFTVTAKPIKTTAWHKKHDRFEAMVNDIAKVKDWTLEQREDFKKDCKVNWGKVEYRHDMITGRKTARLPSIMEYSEDELKTIAGELEVWMVDNGIYEDEQPA